MRYALVALALTLVPTHAFAADDGEGEGHVHGHAHHDPAAGCGAMAVWDPDTAMCEPYPMAGMPMRMLMLHGNLFGTRTGQTGDRARDAWASTNMLMADLGTSAGSDRHYVGLEVMATAEKWTFPDRGYPLLLQIGESDATGRPFVDAQHPHNSPLMGLTLSDRIALGDPEGKDYLKLTFSPRGEATDGPIAFMHRITGSVNPDAPLGHHVGQDVGHITSTVIAASWKTGDTWFEASVYHGAEPEPESVDLPIGAPDSMSVRLIRQFTPDFLAMVSAARVSAPETDHPEVPFEGRYSASGYWRRPLAGGWNLYSSLIFGLVTQYDHAPSLASFTGEFLVQGDRPMIWGRLEVLQRTPEELGIDATAEVASSGRWVTAATLGYTHRIASWSGVGVGLGASVTKDFLPADFRAAYGGDPWTFKALLQLGGMRMWDL